jgi:hypothetical protein
VFERAGCGPRAIACYERAIDDRPASIDVIAEALYRLALRCRRDRRFADAAAVWRRILELKPRRSELVEAVQRCAVEALAIHHEHRQRDYEGARELALLLLEEPDFPGDSARHRIARLDRKIHRVPLLD